jgi:hypothetical protein
VGESSLSPRVQVRGRLMKRNTSREQMSSTLKSKSFEKKFEDIYDVVKPLGEGSFGQVKLCCLKEARDTLRAVKMIDRTRFGSLTDLQKVWS